MKIGMVGLGVMGLPMARNLLRAGLELWVWNRTPERAAELLALGARQAQTVDALCAEVDVVCVALLDAAAWDAVLGTGTPAFARRCQGRTWVQLGTISAADSLAFACAIREHGGCYVEAPVSGSRIPAEQARLVGMLAGDADAVSRVEPLMQHLCRAVYHCGAVPNAMRMKLAVNHFLIVLLTALAESVHAARAAGVNLELMAEILNAGPMASEVSRIKMGKLLARDFAPQAAIHDVRTIAQLVAGQARSANAYTPLIAQCAALFATATAAGGGAFDMCAVLEIIAANPQLESDHVPGQT